MVTVTPEHGGTRGDTLIWQGGSKCGRENKEGKKKTVTQGGTQTRDLANGLPCSNELSTEVTRQLSGRIRVLKAELPGIQPKQIPSWHVRWGGAVSAKREAQRLRFLTCSRPDSQTLNLSQRQLLWHTWRGG